MSPASIWFRPFTLEEIRGFERDTFASYIGVEFTEIGPDFLAGRFAVVPHMHQPFGVLHGGASAALAETLGSVAANFVVDPSRYRCVGQAISASHLRPVKDGYATGVARPKHLGDRNHVWEIEMRREDGKPFCIASLTMAVLAR